MLKLGGYGSSRAKQTHAVITYILDLQVHTPHCEVISSVNADQVRVVAEVVRTVKLNDV